MNLDEIRKHIQRRDNWEMYPLDMRQDHLRELADDVPGLVAEVERLTGVADRANKATK